jgi:FixJ family two-component response regulator
MGAGERGHGCDILSVFARRKLREVVSEFDSIVFVVDDDRSFRRSLERLLRTAGYHTQSFVSAEEFLQSAPPELPACLVCDVSMPGLSGLDLQRKLAHRRRQLPIIFITGHGDIPMSVQAMKAGAFEFLTKPFREQALLNAIEGALHYDRVAREMELKLANLRMRYESLTPREREVMSHVIAGLLNKQIAAELHIVEKTIKFHRAHIMDKMQAESVAQLVRMAGELEVLPRA